MTRGMIVGALIALSIGCGPGSAPVDGGGADAGPGDARTELPDGADGGPGPDDDASLPPVVDDDRDDDGVPDALDPFPDDPRESEDPDGDGVGSVADPDEDGDGSPDVIDELPLDPSGSSYREVASIAPGGMPAAAASVGALPVRFPITIGGAGPASAFVALASGEPGGVTLVVEGAGASTVEILALEAGVLLYPHRDRVLSESRTVSFATETDALVVGFEIAGRAAGARDLTILAYADGDLDGLDDARETALGLRSYDGDSDDDGVGDADDLAAPLDPDGDGVPSFLDGDSDGDGLDDRLDGTSDHDRDGLPALVDLDADGDGEDDVGSDPFADLDADRIPDHADVDDDGDGLRDVVDGAPRAPLAVDLAATTGISVESVHTEIGADVAPGAIVAGATLVLTGAGLDGIGAEIVVFGAGGPEPLSATPTSVSATAIRVVAPPGATAPVRVVRGGVLASEPIDATAVDLDAGQPLLFEQPVATAWPAPLRGRNLERIHRIQIAGRRLAPTFEAGVASVGAEGSGPMHVESADGTSNTVMLRMSMPGSAFPVTMPSGSTIDPSTLVVSSTFEDAPDSGGSSWFAPPTSVTQGAELVSAITIDGAGVGRDCLTLMGFTIDGYNPGLDASSTAVALALTYTGGARRVHPNSLETLRGRMAALPETAALAALVDARLAADDPCPLAAPDAAMLDAILALSVAAEADLAAGLADGTLQPPGVQSHLRPTFPLRFASITPEQFDVAVMQTASTENVEVENDSSLNLSARIETSPGGQVLVPHVGGYFDARVIGGQSGVLTGYRASTTTFDQPRGRNVRVRVITPGFAEPNPTDAAERDVQFTLAFRTAVEGLLLPAIDAAVGGVGPRVEVLLHLILQQSYLAVLDARMAYEAGDRSGFLGAVVAILLRDVDNVGPITQGIARLVGGAVTARLAERIAARLVPVLGQIAAIVDVVSTAASATNIGKVVVDLGSTPGVLEYEVDFGFGITGVEPRVLERAFRPASVTIHGSGFWGLDGTGRRVRPRVRVRDAGGTERTYDVRSITDEGTELEVVLPGDFMASARGPLFFAVDRGGEVMEHPVGVAVEQLLRITASAPDPIGPGQRLLLSGAGFGHDPRRVRVWFYGVDAAGADIQLRGRVVEHTHHELAVITPSGLVADRAWEVEVDVTDPSGALAESNRHPLNVRCVDLSNSVWDATVTWDLCTTPRVYHLVVAFDVFTPPWAPGGTTGGWWVDTGDPVLDGRLFGMMSACQPPALLSLTSLGIDHGGAHNLPTSSSVNRLFIMDPAIPVQGIASPDGNTFRWFQSYLDGCSGSSFFPLVPDRAVMTRRR